MASAPGGPRRAASITWKRPPADLSTARRILAHARPNDVVLAPMPLSQTLAAISGDVYTVNPRTFYTKALAEIPAARSRERLLLSRFAVGGLRAGTLAAVMEALRAVRVDLACLPAGDAGALAVLRAAGYHREVRARRLECLRRSPGGAADAAEERGTAPAARAL